ncbi:nucleoside phosphatase family-domain-containing protein, partial [Crepidotus variabilis]
MVKRLTRRKVAIAAAVTIGIVYLFGQRARWTKSVQLGSPATSSRDTQDVFRNHDHPSHPVDHNQSPPPSLTFDFSSSSSLPTHPASFSTDPNPHLTTHCIFPHSPTLPLVQWALVIEAGITGSRIHIYKFNNCYASPSFEYLVFAQIIPALSSPRFAKQPEKAAQSLDRLLEHAKKTVPEALWGCTPITVKATARLWLSPATEPNIILDAVEHRLRTAYPFRLSSKPGEGVKIMDEKEEGIYEWITANYLLGTIGGETAQGEKSTYAVLDLGGGSTRLVFESSFAPFIKDEDAKGWLDDDEHKYELNFARRAYTLYQHSYSGYGLLNARKSIHALVESISRTRILPSDEGPMEDAFGNEIIANACLARGLRKTVEVATGFGGKRKVTMSGESSSFEACSEIIQLVLAKKPHSSLLNSFPEEHGKILLLLYFYDRVRPLLYPDGVDPSKARSLQP